MREFKELSFGPDFEKYLNRNEFVAVEKYEYRDFRVFIGEGGPYHEANPDFPFGWYETIYLLAYRDPSNGKDIVCFRPLAFDFSHDLNLGSQDSRRKARINSAKSLAHEHVDEFWRTWLGNSIPTILNS